MKEENLNKFFLAVFFSIMSIVTCLVVSFCFKISHKLPMYFKIGSIFNKNFKINVKYRVQNELTNNSFLKFFRFNLFSLNFVGKYLENGVYRKKDMLLRMPILPDRLSLNAICSKIDEFCRKSPSRIYFLILPTKFQLCGGLFDENRFSNYEKDLISNVYSQLSGRLVTVRSNVFSIYEDDFDVFYRTDSSFNSFGYFLIYCNLLKQMGKTPFDMSYFEIKPCCVDFFGGLFNSVFANSVRPDTILLFNLNSDFYSNFYKFRVQQVYDQFSVDERNSVFDLNQLNSKDKKSVFFGNENPVFKIVENCTDFGSNENLLIFSDGSVDGLMQFLVLHFKKIVVVNLRMLNRLRLNIAEDLCNKLKNVKFDQTLFFYQVEKLNEPKHFDRLKMFVG